MQMPLLTLDEPGLLEEPLPIIMNEEDTEEFVGAAMVCNETQSIILNYDGSPLITKNAKLGMKANKTSMSFRNKQERQQLMTKLKEIKSKLRTELMRMREANKEDEGDYNDLKLKAKQKELSFTRMPSEEMGTRQENKRLLDELEMANQRAREWKAECIRMKGVMEDEWKRSEQRLRDKNNEKNNLKLKMNADKAFKAEEARIWNENEMRQSLTGSRMTEEMGQKTEEFMRIKEKMNGEDAERKKEDENLRMTRDLEASKQRAEDSGAEWMRMEEVMEAEEEQRQMICTKPERQLQAKQDAERIEATCVRKRTDEENARSMVKLESELKRMKAEFNALNY